jgi:hypothetical protein
MHIPLGDVPFAGNKVDFPFLEDGPKPTRRQESSAHAEFMSNSFDKNPYLNF